MLNSRQPEVELPNVQYHHAANGHSLEGAVRGMGYMRARGSSFDSLLDVGAGTGNWLLAARNAGVNDVFGVDGIPPTGRHVWVDTKRNSDG